MIAILVHRSAPESSCYGSRRGRREHGLMTSYVMSRGRVIYLTLYKLRYTTMHRNHFGGSINRSWFMTPKKVLHLSRFKTRMTKP